jgi:hypothetical protein
MPSRLNISRRYPSICIALLDCSHSMNDLWGSNGLRKIDEASHVLNQCIADIGSHSIDAAGNYSPRTFIMAYSYSFNNLRQGDILKPLLDEGWSDRLHKKNPDHRWVQAHAPVGAGTPMAHTFDRLREALKEMFSNLDVTRKLQNSIGPIIFNITDGELSNSAFDFGTDSPQKTEDAAQALKDMKTPSGAPILLFNAHIGGDHEKILYPTEREKDQLDEHARFLYKISSMIPEEMQNNGKNRGIAELNDDEIHAGMIRNASPGCVMDLIQMGTIVEMGR